MAIDDHIEEMFQEWIISTQKGSEDDGRVYPNYMMFTQRDDNKDKFGIGVMPLPMEMLRYGKNKNMLSMVMKAAAARLQAVAVMIFMEMNMIMMEAKDKEDMEGVIKAVQDEKIRVEDMRGSVDVLLCICETNTKQIARFFKKIPTAPVQWEEMFTEVSDKMSFTDSRFCNILYEQPPFKKFSSN